MIEIHEWQLDDFGRQISRETDLVYEFEIDSKERLCVFADSLEEAKEVMTRRGGFALESIIWSGTHRRTWLWDRYENQIKKERGN